MKPITEQSLYEILEIPRDAAADAIEKAYQRAKALYGPGSLATYSLVAPEEMALLNRRIEEAHRVLLDAGARAGYDASLSVGTSTATGAGGGGDGAPAAAVAATVPPAAPSGAGPEPAGPAPRAPEAAGATPAAPGPTPPPAPAAAGAEPARQPAPAAAVPARPAFSAPEGAPWTGELVRQAREGRGMTLHQVADRTKVARHHLENIEADRYELLPAPVYLRGILISVAKELRLDPQKVSRSYLESMQAAQALKAPPKPK